MKKKVLFSLTFLTLLLGITIFSNAQQEFNEFLKECLNNGVLDKSICFLGNATKEVTKFGGFKLIALADYLKKQDSRKIGIAVGTIYTLSLVNAIRSWKLSMSTLVPPLVFLGYILLMKKGA